MALDIEKYGFEINGLRHVSGKESLEILKEAGLMIDVRPDFELTKLMNIEHILYYPYDEIRDQYQDLPRETWLIIADAVGLRQLVHDLVEAVNQGAYFFGAADALVMGQLGCSLHDEYFLKR